MPNIYKWKAMDYRVLHKYKISMGNGVSLISINNYSSFFVAGAAFFSIMNAKAFFAFTIL